MVSLRLVTHQPGPVVVWRLATGLWIILAHQTVLEVVCAVGSGTVQKAILVICLESLACGLRLVRQKEVVRPLLGAMGLVV